MAGGLGIVLATQGNVIACADQPKAKKNKEMYLAGRSIVDNEIINPSMTNHHQGAICQNRSLVRSACQAFRQDTIVPTMNGGLQKYQYTERDQREQEETYAASSKVMVVSNPSVAASLNRYGQKNELAARRADPRRKEVDKAQSQVLSDVQED